VWASTRSRTKTHGLAPQVGEGASLTSCPVTLDPLITVAPQCLRYELGEPDAAGMNEYLAAKKEAKHLDSQPRSGLR